MEIRRVNVYRVENDKIVEIRIFEGDQYAPGCIHGDNEFPSALRSG